MTNKKEPNTKEYLKISRYEKIEGTASAAQIGAIRQIETYFPEKRIREHLGQGACFLVAYAGSEPLGFIRYYLPGTNEVYRHTDAIVTNRTLVSPEFRRKGVAEKMFLHLFGYAKGKGLALFRTGQNEAMKSFHLKLQTERRRANYSPGSRIPGKIRPSGVAETFEWTKNNSDVRVAGTKNRRRL